MEIRRLFDIPYYQQKNYPLQQSLSGNLADGRTVHYSSDDMIQKINQISAGLLEMGLQAGDKIALISYNNRPEWNLMDLGMMQIGVINVPVYPTISPDEYIYIFNDAQVKYCIVGHGDLLEKVKKAQASVPSLQAIFTFDADVANGQQDHYGNGVNFWETIFSTHPSMELIQEKKDQIAPEDIATIIYTSGTTGFPKGVVLSHKNIVSNVRDVLPFIPLKPAEIALSFLPLCHIFERTVTYAYMGKGVHIHYAKDLETLSETLQELKPHFFTTVPRLLEKVYEKMINNIKKESKIKQKLFFWALGLTEQYDFDWTPSGLTALQWKIADKLIFSKIRARLGGRMKGIVTGAAACPRRMAQFFSAIGIPIREGYGLTETSPAISINIFAPYQAMLGSVGPILPSVEVKIWEDAAYGPGEGEILVKGPTVMQGYYNKPDQTAEVFTEDGWFMTGDIGKLVENQRGVKFLKITDRKKELLKTSGGKYVAPTPIESKLKEDLLIEQAMVVGDNKKFVSVIIQPTFESLQNWCQDEQIDFSVPTEALLKHPKIISYYQEVIDKLNPTLGKVEQIKKFILVTDVWAVPTGELTPTMKLKRRVIMDKYKNEIDQLYV